MTDTKQCKGCKYYRYLRYGFGTKNKPSIKICHYCYDNGKRKTVVNGICKSKEA